MKRNLLFFSMLFAAKLATAQYKPVDQGSALKFTVKNFGFDVPGSFTGLQGSINFDPQNLAAANFDVTIDVATVNTDNSLRDQHLKGEDYFDVKNYPRIRLFSAKVSPGKNGAYTFSGKLTIKGKTNEVAFPFTATTANDGFIFKGTFKIKRKDFGVGGTSTIADELEILLDVAAKKG